MEMESLMFHIFTREVLNIDKMFLHTYNTVVPLPP